MTRRSGVDPILSTALATKRKTPSSVILGPHRPTPPRYPIVYYTFPMHALRVIFLHLFVVRQVLFRCIVE